jgi:hypothetical protein
MDAVTEQSLIQAQAWSVSFAATQPTDQSPLLVVEEPNRLFAVARSISVGEALAVVSLATRWDELNNHVQASSDKVPAQVAQVPAWWRRLSATPQLSERLEPLLLIWLPADAAIPRSMEQRLEAWLSEGRGPKRPTIRSGLRTSRIIASDDRAVIFTSSEQLTDVMDAVVRFTIASRETLQLEKQMAAMWKMINSHTPLIHTVSPKDQIRQAEVKQVTEQVSNMQATILRLQTALEQLDPRTSGSSKRLYAELVEQAGLHERLEMLEDPIEFATDHYELANTRAIEAKNAMRECLLESLIVLLLTAELISNFMNHVP